MRKLMRILIPILILALGMASCAGPTAQETTVTPTAMSPTPTPTPIPAATPSPEQAAVEAAGTAEELRALLERYQNEDKPEAEYLAALRLTRIDPADAGGYTAAADALLRMARANYGEIGRILSLAVDKAPGEAEAIIGWARQNDPGLTLTVPFRPDYTAQDEINADGTCTGNLSNAMKLNDAWLGGFVTAQAGWVYFTRIDENFAIYKMRADGSELQRVGADRGCSLSVAGDWLYYVNMDDGYKPYRMHTDGGGRTKISDDCCGFLSTDGEYVYYDSGSLFRVGADGGEPAPLTDGTVIFPCVWDGWVYYCVKSMEGGLWRMPAEGGEPMPVVERGFIQAYCVAGGYVYYVDMNDAHAVRRVRPDGSEDAEVHRGDDAITTLNMTGGTLLVSAGSYMQDDGILIGNRILSVDAQSGQVMESFDQRTEPVCVAGDWMYFTEYNEGMTWHGVNLITGQTMAVTGEPESSPPAATQPAEPADAGLVFSGGEAAVSEAKTAGELRALMERYGSEGKYGAACQAALRLLELEPTDPDAYTGAVSALTTLSGSYFDEINRLLALGYEKAGPTAITAWAGDNQRELRVETPLLPGETNTQGITAGNLTNAGKYNGEWRGGLLTWQRDWVYLTRPGEDFALYRMRADGSDCQRLGDARGCSLNVVGEWLYYVNTDDDERIYRMRTDGTGNTKLSDDGCAFLSVSNGSLYYDNGSDGGCLYRANLDGGEKVKLYDGQVILPCVSGDWVYFCRKDETGGLWRVSTQGGEPQPVAPGMIQEYCVEGDRVYYVDANEPYGVRQVRTDGTGLEAFYPWSWHTVTFNMADGTLYLPVNTTYQEDGFTISEQIITVDIATGEWRQQFYADTEPVCTGPDGWVYFFKYSDGLAWYAMDAEGQLTRIG